MIVGTRKQKRAKRAPAASALAAKPGKLLKHRRSQLTPAGRRQLIEAAKRASPQRFPGVDKLFDMRGIVSLFGGRSSLIWKLRDYGFISPDPENPMLDIFARHLTLRGIDAWIQRSSLPADWLHVLMDLHQQTEGFPMPLSEFRLASLDKLDDDAKRRRDVMRNRALVANAKGKGVQVQPGLVAQTRRVQKKAEPKKPVLADTTRTDGRTIFAAKRRKERDKEEAARAKIEERERRMKEKDKERLARNRANAAADKERAAKRVRSTPL